MSIRDFDAEFSTIVSSLAAEDPELEHHFRTRMFGSEQDSIDRADSDAMIEPSVRTYYDLDARGYSLAVGRCVAKLAGVKLGSELFDGQT